MLLVQHLLKKTRKKKAVETEFANKIVEQDKKIKESDKENQLLKQRLEQTEKALSQMVSNAQNNKPSEGKKNDFKDFIARNNPEDDVRDDMKGEKEVDEPVKQQGKSVNFTRKDGKPVAFHANKKDKPNSSPPPSPSHDYVGEISGLKQKIAQLEGDANGSNSVLAKALKIIEANTHPPNSTRATAASKEIVNSKRKHRDDKEKDDEEEDDDGNYLANPKKAGTSKKKKPKHPRNKHRGVHAEKDGFVMVKGIGGLDAYPVHIDAYDFIRNEVPGDKLFSRQNFFMKLWNDPAKMPRTE